MAYTSPKTWATGEVLTASDLNVYVRDQFLALAGSSGKVDLSTTSKYLSHDTVILSIFGL